MIILLVTALIFAAALIAAHYADDFYSSGFWSFCVMVSVVSGLTLFILLIFIPIERHAIRRNIYELEAFRETVERSRTRSLNDYERVALLKEIAQWNQNLAGTKYSNQTGWDIWIPDEVENVKPIN